MGIAFDGRMRDEYPPTILRMLMILVMDTRIDTTDTIFNGTGANRRNYRNCSRRSDSLVTR